MTDAATPLPLRPGTWTIDPNHSAVHFKVRHLGLSHVRGRFNRLDATLVVGGTLAESSVSASIDMASVDTNQPDRDAHLRSTDFFSAETHPTMEFTSTSIRARGHQAYEMEGDLVLNAVTRPVILSVEFQGTEVFPADGRVHAGFTALVDLDRTDFGIDFNMPLGGEKMALGTGIRVEMDLQFVAPAEDDPPV